MKRHVDDLRGRLGLENCLRTESCRCDACEGPSLLERTRPADCTFDDVEPGEHRRRRHAPRPVQNTVEAVALREGYATRDNGESPEAGPVTVSFVKPA